MVITKRLHLVSGIIDPVVNFMTRRMLRLTRKNEVTSITNETRRGGNLSYWIRVVLKESSYRTSTHGLTMGRVVSCNYCIRTGVH